MIDQIAKNANCSDLISKRRAAEEWYVLRYHNPGHPMHGKLISKKRRGVYWFEFTDFVSEAQVIQKEKLCEWKLAFLHPENLARVKEFQFRLKQNGLRVVDVACPTRESAVLEILHYAAVYGQDGPVEIYERLGRTFRRVMLNEVRP